MGVRNKEQVNNQSPQGKGNPSDSGQDKAQIKDAKDQDQMKREEEIRQKYTEGADEPAQNVRTKNPNRNTDKPDIDKPAYD